MSHNYNLSDIKRAFCSYIWPVVVVYGCGFMSHNMELYVPGGCRGWEGVCPFFFRGWARDECEKNSDQLVDKGRGKSAASVGAAAARPGLLLRFGEME
jgi:hypothetical protein